MYNNLHNGSQSPYNSKHQSSNNGSNVPTLGIPCSMLGTLIVSNIPGRVNLQKMNAKHLAKLAKNYHKRIHEHCQPLGRDSCQTIAIDITCQLSTQTPAESTYKELHCSGHNWLSGFQVVCLITVQQSAYFLFNSVPSWFSSESDLVHVSSSLEGCYKPHHHSWCEVSSDTNAC